jgi:hypothetical protein
VSLGGNVVEVVELLPTYFWLFHSDSEAINLHLQPAASQHIQDPDKKPNLLTTGILHQCVTQGGVIFIAA